MNTDKIKFENKLLNFKDFVEHSKIFVETGTCYGRSVLRALEAGYNQVRTVEVYEPFYKACAELFQDKPNVKLYYGTSKEKLPEMLKGVLGIAVFFLDAHPAGKNTGGHDDLMEKGKDSEFQQDFILQRELEIILEHSPNHIIIIDDQNGVNAENLHYMKMCLAVNDNYTFHLYDEQDGPNFYKHKSLVCIP